MGQITEATTKCMREYADRDEYFPLTIDEMRQLAFMADKAMTINCRACKHLDTKRHRCLSIRKCINGHLYDGMFVLQVFEKFPPDNI